MITTVKSRPAPARLPVTVEPGRLTAVKGAPEEQIRVVVLEVGSPQRKPLHGDGAFEPLSEDAYFGLPNSYLEYEWQ